MRLVCPNCDAEYEVDAALIPDNGRDVQCSNCGNAWFQPSPFAEAEAANEEALFDPNAGFIAASGPDMDSDDAYPMPDAVPIPAQKPPAGGRAGRNIDASVLTVLREEAERVSRARQQEGQRLEFQGEMGLGGRAPGATAGDNLIADRIAKLKGDAEVYTSAQTAISGSAGSKSQMLPEIETINSTLRAKSEKRGGDSAAVAETMTPDGAGSFRRGFLMAMALIILALGVYLLAPMLSAQFPAAASPLRAFVGYIDGLRSLIDGLMQAAAAQISALVP